MNKILFVSRYYLPHIGGVERHIENVSLNLIGEYGFKVKVLTLKYDHKLKGYEVIDEIEVYRFQLRYSKKIIGLVFLWIHLFKYFKLFLTSDIIHIHDVFIWILPFRMLFFWKKFYTTYHGWEGQYPISVNSLIQKKIASIFSCGKIFIGKYIISLYKINRAIITYGGTKLHYLKRVNVKNLKAIYIGRLEVDTGIPLLLKYLEKHNLAIEFYGSGPYKKECSKYGSVFEGVSDFSEILKNSDICFCGGYLSTLDSMAMSNITVVYTGGYVRKLAFTHTPFRNWIFTWCDEKELYLIFKTLQKVKVNNLNKRILKAHNWSKNQTWQKLARKYILLWSS